MFRVPDGPYVRGGLAFCGAALGGMVLPAGTTVWGVAGVVHGYLSGIAVTRDLECRAVYIMSPCTRGNLRVPPTVQPLLTAALTPGH
ncbi:hypothetical protein [Streptomyces sp. CNQ431]|uniref:hypothetical protein n=1 Tax=Streptomyces sp. CNQ431 TaxID=1571532 RepID=UPI000AABE4D7|nr:hypothetical protein [Streptomyces sp. CNQ431]